MTTHTHYLWFETKKRQEIIDITDEVAEQVRASGVREGMVLVSAMHISASVFVNDHESGPLARHPPVAGGDDRALGSRRATGTTRPARTTPPRTSGASPWATRSSSRSPAGKLDLGPWQRVFYGEWDGQRRKRVIIKVLGEQ